MTRFRSVKAQALLVFLALAEDTPHSRDALARFFWPDQETAQAKQNLRQTLARLRTALKDDGPQPILRVNRQSVKLNREAVWLDVDVLRSRLADVKNHQHPSLEECPSCALKLEQAVSLVRGDLVAGFAPDELDRFEEWLVVERERFRQQALDLLWRLGNLAERRRQFDKAQDYARRQLELEPWREEAHLQLITALAQSGQRSRALAQFETCKWVLAEELGVEPSAPLINLAEQLKRAEMPTLGQDSEVGAEHNLPAQLTPFVGREKEVAALTERLCQPGYRLLSLVGPGGIGKTRLALEVGLRQLDRFRGVYFVPLVSVQSVDDVPTAMLQSLGVSSSGSKLAPEDQVVSVLEGKAFLLILDNLEHLSDMPPFLTKLLEKLPELVLLVTSRARMGLQAEDVFFLKGLSAPEEASSRAANYAALRLYLDRARRVQKDFRLEASNLADVVRICRKVEGLPLAIELAASWTELLGTAHIADALDESLEVLRADLQDLAPHHRNMEAVFEQSWKLLSPEEQAALARLSVFKGSFGVEAAQQVLGVGVLELTRLRYKSLLRVSEAGRLDMHELLRQFAGQKLSPEALLKVSEAHATFYLNLLASQHDGLAGLNPKAVSAELQKDLDNIRQAWRWAVSHSNTDLVNQSVSTLSKFYTVTGLLEEGQQVFKDALAQLPTTKATRQARLYLLLGLATIMFHQNKFALALQRLDEASSLATALGDTYAYLTGQCIKGDTVYYLRGPEASLIQASQLLPAIRTAGFRDLEAQCLRIMARNQSDHKQQISFFEQALELSRDLADRSLEQRLLIHLGIIASEQNAYTRYKSYLDEAASLSDYVANDYNTGLILNWIGHFYLDVGQYKQAIDVYQTSQEHCRKSGLPFLESFIEHSLCFAYTLLGKLPLAVEKGEAALRLARQVNVQDTTNYALMHLAYAQLALGRFDLAERYFTESCKGWTELGYAARAAEARAGLADVYHQQGDTEQARRQVEEIIAFIEDHDLDGVDDPFRIYLTCYTILTATNDKRAAPLLSDAQRLLQSYAATIEEPQLRSSFLNNVPFNRKILDAWRSKTEPS